MISLKKSIFFLPFTFFLQSLVAQSDTINWKADIEYLRLQLPDRHLNLFSKWNKAAYDSSLNEIEARLPHLNNLQVAIQLQQAVARCGDSHTSLSWGQFLNPKKLLPLETWWFDDGLYVVQTLPTHAVLLGKRLKKINGHPVETIIDSLSSLMTVDNHATLISRTPYLLQKAELLQYFGFIDSAVVTLEFQALNDSIHTIPVMPGAFDIKSRLSYHTQPLAFCWRNTRRYFVQKYFPEDKIYYVQYNRCYSKESMRQAGKKEIAKNMPSFKEFKKEVLRTLEKEKPEKLIFDLRFNSGGFPAEGLSLIQELSKNLKINQQGKLFVVIGNKTFSAAVIHAMAFREKTQATLVGTPTMGKPNFYGRTKNFQLPYSKLNVVYSTAMAKTGEEGMTTVYPDVELKTTFSDCVNGIDPVYEWVKKQ